MTILTRLRRDCFSITFDLNLRARDQAPLLNAWVRSDRISARWMEKEREVSKSASAFSPTSGVIRRSFDGSTSSGGRWTSRLPGS